MCSGKRGGFTLLELMVVLGIVSLLTALVFSAVSSSREAARRTVCLHKMTQVASAIQQFQTARNHYPGWRHNPFSARDALTNRSITFSTSWFGQLLPYVGRNDIYDGSRKGNLKWPYVVGGPGGVPRYFAPPMPGTLVCPSDSQKMRASTAETSYVVNAGRQDGQANASVPADWRSNGIFLDLLGWRGDPSKRVMVSRTDSSFIRQGDGLSTTLMLSENIDAGRWPQISEPATGFIFYPPGQVPGHRINGPGAPSTPAFLTARPSSNHPGGVNVVFAAGNGRFVREDMDYIVYCALMTPKGQAAREPGSRQPSVKAITEQPILTADSY